MKYLNYIFFRLTVAFFSVIPFKVVYMISDVLSIVLKKFIKYRLDVVISNLRNSDLGLDEATEKKVINGIYKNLCDIILEGIKGNSLSSKSIKTRYRILNPELLNPYYKNNKDVIILGGHYLNWEWGARALAIYLKHNLIGVYKPLSNPFIDTYIKNVRMKDKMIMVGMHETMSSFENPKYKPGAFVLLSDQNPSNKVKAYWMDFLGRKTAVIHGPDNYSKKFNLPVIYGDIVRVKRGYYEVTLRLITETPNQLDEGYVSYLFMKKLEKIIKNDPSNWLWTHKRWKTEFPGPDHCKVLN